MRLVTEGRVVRARHTGKARWVVHAAECPYAPGCVPLTDLVDCLTERGVIVRLRRGLIARCVTCRPILIDTTKDTP